MLNHTYSAKHSTFHKYVCRPVYVLVKLSHMGIYNEKKTSLITHCGCLAFLLKTNLLTYISQK
ncbi:hypothetical protein Hanom_Chr08g00724981 [Helianthus anomalus]